MWTKIKALREERGQFLADMKKILKKAEDEKRSLTPEEDNQFNELNTKAEQRQADIQRYETAQQLEADLTAQNSGDGEQRAGREDINTPEAQASQQEKEQRAQIDKYLRTGVMPSADEQRAVTVSGSGIVGDRPIYNQLVASMKTFAGVRQAGATILSTATGDDLAVPKADDTSNTGQIVGEAVEDNTEADPTVGNVVLKPVKFDSKWIKVSLEMLQDASYPLESYILNIAGERIGRSFNTYSTTGTGTAQPHGFLVAGSAGKTAASLSAITYEELVDLVHSVDAGYRSGGNFRLMLHDTTLAAVRKLKDSGGHYIFGAGAAGIPSTILDYQYVVNNDMAQLSDGASSKVVAAGDFSRYFVRDVTGITIVRATELFAGSGLVGFRIFSRHDGRLTDLNAIKYLKTAAA